MRRKDRKADRKKSSQRNWRQHSSIIKLSRVGLNDLPPTISTRRLIRVIQNDKNGKVLKQRPIKDKKKVDQIIKYLRDEKRVDEYGNVIPEITATEWQTIATQFFPKKATRSTPIPSVPEPQYEKQEFVQQDSGNTSVTSQEKKLDDIPQAYRDVYAYLDEIKSTNGFQYDLPPSHQQEWKEFVVLFEKAKEKYPLIKCPRVKDGVIPHELLTSFMTIYASEDMLSDFIRFQGFLLYLGANYSGICLVVPYEGYDPAMSSHWLKSIPKARPYAQHVSIKERENGPGIMNLIESKPRCNKPTSVLQHYKRCMKVKPTPSNLSKEEIVDKIWDEMPTVRKNRNYYKDVPGTLFKKGALFNLNKLDTILTEYGDWNQGEGSGIVDSYLYMGSYGTGFVWHVEDYCLPSGNFNWGGNYKYWMGVPPLYYTKMVGFLKREEIAQQVKNRCPSYCLHKHLLCPASKVRENGIPVNEVFQPSRTFVFTFEAGFHGGLNLGFNLSEASNFSCSPEWPMLAITNFGCKQEEATCAYGTVPSKSADPWARKFVDKGIYDSWVANKLEIPHPLDPFGESHLFGKNISTHAPLYRSKEETEEEGLRLRTKNRTNS